MLPKCIARAWPGNPPDVAALRLVTQTFLVTVLFHPLAAFVLRDFGFASFL